jgi:hypothetical protein
VRTELGCLHRKNREREGRMKRERDREGKRDRQAEVRGRQR